MLMTIPKTLPLIMQKGGDAEELEHLKKAAEAKRAAKAAKAIKVFYRVTVKVTFPAQLRGSSFVVH